MDVRIDNLVFRRGGRDVLAVPALHIRADRTTAVLGPNGAGKTSLLRLIAGLERPHRGSLTLSGANGGAKRGGPRVGYVFQEQVFLRRSIVENVELGLLASGVPHADARRRALEALAWLGIESLAARRADEVSGGEARRASLARALALDAPLLLLDEPMAGLDGTTYARLLDDLPGLLAGHRATSVLVTHRAEEAFRLAHDLVILIDGRVAAAGPTQAIATDPRRAEVARVLGYSIVDLGSRRVAVPPRGLALGTGPVTFGATVVASIDLVSEWDVVVDAGQERLHVPLARTETPPQPGDAVRVHAPVCYSLDA